MLLRLLRTYLRPYRTNLIAIVVLQLISSLATLYLPSLNAQIIDDGVAKGDSGYIISTGSWMLLITAAQVTAAIAQAYVGARTAMGLGRDIRRAIFGRVMSFSAREVGQFGAPSLITRNTNDVQQVQLLVVMGTTIFVAAPITAVGGLVMALREDAGLSWLLLISVPALAIAVGLIVWRMVPQFRLMQTRIDAVNRVLREQITGIRVVRAFIREPEEQQRFDAANEALTQTAVRAGRLQALIFPTVMLVLNASSVAVLWFGGFRVDDGDIQIGALTAFLAYLMQILMAVMMATFLFMLVPRSAVSAERITEVLDTRSSVVPPEEPIPAGADVGVELDHATFTFPGADEPVLRDITFTARAGTTTAIIGSTGSGKTTLLNLIARLVDVTDGAVRIDGTNVRDLSPEQLWSMIGLVPQRPYLFTGTIASNLRYGDPQATDEQLWHALDIAQADFVRDLDGGLDAPIAQGGTNVSGGQRQRLAIARALVRRPQIYLFDDAFSALDLGTDARLRAALKPVTADAVMIVVAQRISTITEADQIIVLEDGRIVGIGTHEQLLVTCAEYTEIAQSQATAAVS
ncbi:ATP-binding cassette domain-containing protein [Epidermidibacterium keratini]|uniref:ATP-binding cassette domain-containing protein n=1 Tax=Epidermidibacterium keratini TaxID=1891644 RepID=A0A7L4YNF4_9ACTN|nr:ABC transporter ATP-binding protein [Epidermidibacterium keratini]QHC00423.1 ATP-binding cassette domain-containing protein [Epidermidibacterium keratini]